MTLYKEIHYSQNIFLFQLIWINFQRLFYLSIFINIFSSLTNEKTSDYLKIICHNLFAYIEGNPGLVKNEKNNTNLNNIGLNNFKIENINSSSDGGNRIRINIIRKNLI